MKDKKRIVFIHYRVGERDGVSLEIEKRARLLTEMGHQVSFISGRDGIERERSYVIEEMELGHTAATFLRDGCFYNPWFDESVMMNLYYAMENVIQKKLTEFMDEIKPDMIYVHNVFSHCYNLPATTALIKLMDRIQVPTVVVNHDFWFEREQFQSPKYFFVKQILDVLPPKRDYFVGQYVINTTAQKMLVERRNLKTKILGDSFDFAFAATRSVSNREIIRNQFGILDDDILVLHATRVTPRKAIENAILFCAALQDQLAGKQRRVFLLLANFIEVDANKYAEELEMFANKLNVKTIWAADSFAFDRKEDDLKMKFSFWDSYAAADLVTFTSILEGYGNQFLEAVAFKKPVVLYEYPVFLTDIKPEGYFYISLGNVCQKENGFMLVSKEAAEQAAQQTVSELSDLEALGAKLEQNFQIAKGLHDESLLATELLEMIEKI